MMAVTYLNKRIPALLAGVFMGASGLVHGQDLPEQCGKLGNAFGPYEYKLERYVPVPGDREPHAEKLTKVEINHFTPEVERLVRGKAGHIGEDLDYTLRAFPNHHRALLSMMRYGQRLGVSTVPSARYSVECYFRRAVAFSPKDPVVRMLFAHYFGSLKDNERGIVQLKIAEQFIDGNGLTAHNIGLLYVELGDLNAAVRLARQARSLGFIRKDLEDKLRAAGKSIEE